MLGICLHEAADVAAAGKMFTLRPQHDDTDARMLIERLEGQAELVALRHRHHVVGRTVEDDVGALMRLIDFNLEAVELRKTGISKS